MYLSVEARPHDLAAEAEPFGAARQRFTAIIQGRDELFSGGFDGTTAAISSRSRRCGPAHAALALRQLS